MQIIERSSTSMRILLFGEACYNEEHMRERITNTTLPFFRFYLCMWCAQFEVYTCYVSYLLDQAQKNILTIF